MKTILVVGLGWILGAQASAQLQVVPRSLQPLGAQAVDQHGQAFTVTGLSGLTYVGGERYLAVLDNSDKVVELVVQLAPDGSITSATFGAGLTLAESRDFEGIADPGSGQVLLSTEDGPDLRSYALSGGALAGTIAPPPIFNAIRNNRGFEALTVRCDRSALWFANEEALTVDGPVAGPGQSTVVRLQRMDLGGPVPTAAAQFAYEVEPMHGGALPNNGGQSGLVELVSLPDGTLLALERSAALAFPLFQSRLYELDLVGATDVSGFPALAGATYTPVGKRLLWQGSAANLEGLCLGPELPGGNHALIGVIDDGDPTSISALVPFELIGATRAACACTVQPYCVLSPNTAGAGARLQASGGTSLSQADLVLQVSGGPPSQFALLFFGTGRAQLPAGAGVRCVGGTLTRLSPFPLDATGQASQPLTTGSLPAGVQVLVGDLRQFQCWYRDPAGALATYNFSDALELRFCP